MHNQEVVLKDLPKRKILYLSCKGSWRQLPSMLTRLREQVSLGSKETLVPPSGFYFNTPKEVAIEDLDWEVFYPVGLKTPVFTDDNAKYGVREVSATRVASIIHEDEYRKTSSSYEKLQAWIKAHNLTLCGPAEELYLSDIGKANEEQRIELRLPVC
jgi:effector-binding domain-containing protein